MTRVVAGPTPRAAAPAGAKQAVLGEIRKPEAGEFSPPVAWLFGRQFIASLKWILLYTAFKGKLDARDWMRPDVIPSADPAVNVWESWKQWGEAARDAERGEFWFDYISDTGDGQRAVYSIAYLCMSDLVIDKDAQVGDEASFVAHPDPADIEASGKRLLPRGTFLFVGGDTSYHISDYATITERFYHPFRWAYKDLHAGAEADSVRKGRPRLLLGIPGNHDYYDALDGFNRQFRRPLYGEREPQLEIPTFERMQEASYVTLRLPHEWWLWGMDTEEGEIDYRQKQYLDNLRESFRPKRLIVATPEPTTAFGKYAKADAKQSKTFKALKLERPFIEGGDPVAPGKCRLDLSGDIHHYARHWGTPKGTQEPANYASVMAGGGGAFFHPTHTTVEEVEPVVIYPEMDDSRTVVADELFKFWNIVRGGFVWLFGAVIAFVICFAANFPYSTRDAFDSLPLFVSAGLSSEEIVSEIRTQPLNGYVRQMPRTPWLASGDPPRGWSNPPSGYYQGIALMGLSLVLLGAGLYYTSKLFKKEYDPENWNAGARRDVSSTQRFILWALVFGSFFCLELGVWHLQAEQNLDVLTRLGRSLIILTGLVWSLMAVAQSLRYSEYLFEEAHHRTVRTRHYWPLWALIIMSVLGFGSCAWFFGKHESSYLISDVLLLAVVFGVFLGLIVFAVSTGAGLKRGAGKAGFLVLGASHGLLQLLVPYVLIRKGHLLWAPLAMAAVVVGFKYLGRRLAKMKQGWPMVVAWVALGAALLAVPFLFNAGMDPKFFGDLSDFNRPEGSGARLALCFLAAGAGAVMSCVLFGWYLAVSLAYHGHNNEAGGAARIEGFKQIVRVCLTPEGLTGYVIAFDKPETDGSKLRPRIRDIFRVSER